MDAGIAVQAVSFDDVVRRASAQTGIGPRKAATRLRRLINQINREAESWKNEGDPAFCLALTDVLTDAFFEAILAEDAPVSGSAHDLLEQHIGTSVRYRESCNGGKGKFMISSPADANNVLGARLVAA